MVNHDSISARALDATVRIKEEKKEKKTKKKPVAAATKSSAKKNARKSSKKKSGKKASKAGKSDDAPSTDALTAEQILAIQRGHRYPDDVSDELLAQYRCLCFCDSRSLLQHLWRDFFCTSGQTGQSIRWGEAEYHSMLQWDSFSENLCRIR